MRRLVPVLSGLTIAGTAAAQVAPPPVAPPPVAPPPVAQTQVPAPVAPVVSAPLPSLSDAQARQLAALIAEDEVTQGLRMTRRCWTRYGGRSGATASTPSARWARRRWRR